LTVDDRRIAFLTLSIAMLLGAAAGLGAFTVGYADSLSYLSNDPNACANCHAMKGHLDAWAKSSHGKFAACNDCHAPHDNVVNKYYCKARNGFFHSLAFTTGDFPDNLLITDYNRGVTESACRHCHSAVTHGIENISVTERSDALVCTSCHSTVGHDR
jgi:cytochrome c nitrite reductase small subunit